MLRLIHYAAGISVLSWDAPKGDSVFKKRLWLLKLLSEMNLLKYIFVFLKYQNCIFIQ